MRDQRPSATHDPRPATRARLDLPRKHIVLWSQTLRILFSGCNGNGTWLRPSRQVSTSSFNSHTFLHYTTQTRPSPPFCRFRALNTRARKNPSIASLSIYIYRAAIKPNYSKPFSQFHISCDKRALQISI